MRTWYLAKDYSWAPRIEPVEVEKSTASSIWVGGQRRAIESGMGSYFPSWDQAKAHLLARSNERRRLLQSRLDNEKDRHAQIFALKEPTP